MLVLPRGHPGCGGGNNVICIGYGDRLNYHLQYPSPCNGDSGGPMVCRRNRLWQLDGVASFNPPGRQCIAYAAYTPVIQHLNWIMRTMQNN